MATADAHAVPVAAGLAVKLLAEPSGGESVSSPYSSCMSSMPSTSGTSVQPVGWSSMRFNVGNNGSED